MKVNNNHAFDDNIKFIILEVLSETLQQHFIHRYQIIISVNKELLVPRYRAKYFEFNTDIKTFPIQSEITKETLTVPAEDYLEKEFCNRTLDECNELIANYSSKFSTMSTDEFKEEILRDFIPLEVVV